MTDPCQPLLGNLMPLVLAVLLGLGGCSNDGEPMTELSLRTTNRACQGQRAQVPTSGIVKLALAGQAFRNRSAEAGYVALQLRDENTFTYLSFAPDLPDCFTTEEARAKLEYAYFNIELKQSADIGGAVTILFASDVLKLSDFDQFEVRDGQLQWHVVRQNTGSYWKMLSAYDNDPTNDPQTINDCRTDDIAGMCCCYFSGPPTQVDLSGAMSLSSVVGPNCQAAGDSASVREVPKPLPRW